MTTTIGPAAAGWVYVAVPEELLLDVYGFVAARGRESQRSEAEPERIGAWTAERIADLREAVTNHAVRTLLELCTARPGDWVSIREVEAEGQVTMPQVRAGLAGFSMLLKSRFKLSGSADWPMNWAWINGAIAYRLNPRIAEWWRASGK